MDYFWLSYEANGARKTGEITFPGLDCDFSPENIDSKWINDKGLDTQCSPSKV